MLVGDEVYIDQPQNTLFPFDFATEFAQYFNKLMQGIRGRNKLTEVQLHTVSIDTDGTLSGVAIDSDTPV